MIQYPPGSTSVTVRLFDVNGVEIGPAFTGKVEPTPSKAGGRLLLYVSWHVDERPVFDMQSVGRIRIRSSDRTWSLVDLKINLYDADEKFIVWRVYFEKIIE